MQRALVATAGPIRSFVGLPCLARELYSRLPAGVRDAATRLFRVAQGFCRIRLRQARSWISHRQHAPSQGWILWTGAYQAGLGSAGPSGVGGIDFCSLPVEFYIGVHARLPTVRKQPGALSMKFVIDMHAGTQRPLRRNLNLGSSRA